VDITDEHLEMMAAPRYGFGRFMNPCIDCHALMFRKAGEIMTAEGGDFLFSGEVLGQRPKSQNRKALDLVARLSGYEPHIVRPLSAKALPPTDLEKSGRIDRGRLAGFQGRTRQPQMEMARRFGLTDYPAPAGGCLLTDPAFSRRLRELYDRAPRLDPFEVELLKVGRHFRLPGGAKAIVGRNAAENARLESRARARDLLITATGYPGPTTMIPGGADNLTRLDEDLRLAGTITVSYGDAPPGQAAEVGSTTGGGDGGPRLWARTAAKSRLAEWMV
jgi:tRNA U34 2-thiouridine synthase MnmA/TrmU